MTKSVWLLDVNVLIAMTHDHHLHHAQARTWFEAVSKRRWATCALTQLAFIRLACHPRISANARSAAEVMQGLEDLVSHPQHEYWDESPAPCSTSTLTHPAFVGHRQVTDLYLLEVAVQRGQILATMDRGIASFAAAAGMDAHLELVGGTLSVQEPRPKYAARRARA